MPSVNPALAAIFQAHLLPFFEGVDTSRAEEGHPWWWPIGNAETLAAWAVDPVEHADLAGSLQGRDPSQDGHPRFGAYPGSLSAVPGAVMLVTTRPSTSSWPASRSSRSNLINQLHRVFTTDELEAGALHISDFIKFRGEGGDGEALKRLSAPQWTKGLECLLAEVELLDPEYVLLSLSVAAWIKDLADGRRVRLADGSRWSPPDLLRRRLAQLRRRPRVAPVPGLYAQVNAMGKAMTWRRALGRQGDPPRV